MTPAEPENALLAEEEDGWTLAEPRTSAATAETSVGDVPMLASDAYSAEAYASDAYSADALADDWLGRDSLPAAGGEDVDAALAAVASLSMVSDREADREADDMARVERAAEPKRIERAVRQAGIPAPQGMTLRRGQLASAIPALLLIVIGGGWTFANTTGGQIAPNLLFGGAAALVAAVFVLGWLSFGRWARGLLFLAALVAATIGLIAFTLTTPGLELTTSYPLLLAAPGLACLIAAVLARPASTRLLVLAVLLIAGAAVGIAYNAGLFPLDLTPYLQYLLPVTGGVLLLLWAIGALARRA
ncbi:MAG: hypothetical protein IPK19_02940 [Chloroflexi bacterium]|nr:hypothetical protein [Chloroflexota bacterium]